MSTTKIKTVTVKFDIPGMEKKIKTIETERKLFSYAKYLKGFIELGLIKSSPAITYMFNKQLEKIYNEN